MSEADEDPWKSFKALTTPLKRRHLTHESTTYTPPVKVSSTLPTFARPVDLPSQGLPSEQEVLSFKKRRKLQPEKSIDLHGMTKDEAYENLVRFIHFSIQHQRKVVLIITGKGRVALNSAEPSTLRACLPLWVRASPLKQWVHSVVSARSEHGGQGSFYIVLRARPLDR